MIDKNKFEFILLKSLQRFFMLIGVNAGRRIAVFLAYFLYYVVRLRKDIVRKNLHLAFPELSEKEIKKLVFENLRSSLITFIEVLTLPKFDKKGLLKLLKKNDLPEFLEQYTKDQSVLLLTGHFGNWEYAAIWVGLALNIQLNVLVKPMRNPYATELLRKNRTKYGNIEIPVGLSVKELLKKLEQKEAVGIVADQRGRREGTKVKFFGRETSVYTGSALLAIKTMSPVLFIIAVREKDYRYKMIYEEIKYDDLEGTTEEKIAALTQRYFNVLEKYIRQYPEQWFWMHNIWKY